MRAYRPVGLVILLAIIGSTALPSACEGVVPPTSAEPWRALHLTGVNIDALGEHLAGHTTLFVGPSGAGKSSLLNALQPGLGLRVGELSQALQRGKHTTVGACLHPLDIGGYVVDTPGLGMLQFSEVGEVRLDACFPEFVPHLELCRFDDCVHVHEPGCGVRQAVTGGEIAERRYESYVKILGERED